MAIPFFYTALQMNLQDDARKERSDFSTRSKNINLTPTVELTILPPLQNQEKDISS